MALIKVAIDDLQSNPNQVLFVYVQQGQDQELGQDHQHQGHEIIKWHE